MSRNYNERPNGYLETIRNGLDGVRGFRDSFVEDEGWHRASAAYANYLRKYDGQHVLYLEIGVGSNTPVFCSMRTKRKPTRNTIKRQISEGSHTWINGFERRCA